MKKIFGLTLCFFASVACFSQEIKRDTLLLQPIEIDAVRAGDKSPFTKTNITKSGIESSNLGQDLPFLLNQVPSTVINSDAGNGIGYTNIRIRGTDATRINVTLNGIPYNDAESQGTFFVDLPDFLSSANSIQVQRGVGTSSNGAGAFGATVNLSTNEVNDKFYAEMNNSYGSFNSWKHTLKFGSGLIGNHLLIEGRLSKLSSNGYIDRASSDLRSAYGSIAYIDDRNSLRLNVFSGKEKTYQAWYGVPQDSLGTHRTYNPAGNEKPGDPYNNETDNYTQTHSQLFYNHKFNKNAGVNAAIFYTRGSGYYEQYKAMQKFNDYGLSDHYDGNTLVTETDLIRRLWLENNFYGTIFSYQQKTDGGNFTFGGGWNKYDGKHLGKVEWAQSGIPHGYHFYDLNAHKKDFTAYTKFQRILTGNLQAYIDLQIRAVKYSINGFKDNPALVINNNFFFFNPKAGLSYTRLDNFGYISWSHAGKEPNRDDFEAGGSQQPLPEMLDDIEIGYQKTKPRYAYGITGYYMLYKNQLVLTGKINDVGAYTRTNIPSSYRAGVELTGSSRLNNYLNVSANLAFSTNKIKNYPEYIDDYDNGGQKVNTYRKADISYSPTVIGSADINIIPVKKFDINLLSKYVSRQYLDNTSNGKRSLDPFFVQDVKLSYSLNKVFKETKLVFQVNNILDEKYEPNGYTYSYYYQGSLNTFNYYFPMAGRNFMIAVNVML